MLPMKALRLDLGALLAADVAYLAPVAANKMVLIKANFALTENLTAGDLTLADFDGSTPIAGVAGAQEVAVDPTTQEQLITIKPPLGGWRWVVTGTTHLPETIYGFALLDATLATLLAAELFSVPIALSAIGEQIDLGSVEMTFVLQPLS